MYGGARGAVNLYTLTQTFWNHSCILATYIHAEEEDEWVETREILSSTSLSQRFSLVTAAGTEVYLLLHRGLVSRYARIRARKGLV